MPTMSSCTIMCPTNLGTQKRWVVIGFPTPHSPITSKQNNAVLLHSHCYPLSYLQKPMLVVLLWILWSFSLANTHFRPL